MRFCVEEIAHRMMQSTATLALEIALLLNTKFVPCVDTFIYLKITQYFVKPGDRGNTVFKVLCYKSEGRWFDPSWSHWKFSLT